MRYGQACGQTQRVTQRRSITPGVPDVTSALKTPNKESLEVISAGKTEGSRARFRQQRHNYCPLVKV